MLAGDGVSAPIRFHEGQGAVSEGSVRLCEFWPSRFGDYILRNCEGGAMDCGIFVKLIRDGIINQLE
jgi:hypothetical protein